MKKNQMLFLIQYFSELIKMSLNGRSIKGVLLDITGVLIESSAGSDGHVIHGSIAAVDILKSASK